MNAAPVRSQVLALFNAHRVDPAADFDESHFLDFLLPNSSGKKHLTVNSFAGLRRRNHFLQKIETEFSVCFGTKDLERVHTLESFAARILELQTSPQASRAALQSRLRRGAGWPPILLINAILVSLAVATRGTLWLSVLFGLAAIGFSAWSVPTLIRSRRHDLALARRLGVSKP